MKILILILALFMTVPPVQAGVCDMDQGQISSNMVDSKHDCCPEDDAATQEEEKACDGQLHCGVCTAGTVAVLPMSDSPVTWEKQYVCRLLTASLAPSHTSPPYRPPIS
jgi:hypothetical protein